ncbi:MAG TPA: DNA polymerase Y family protein, partial [Planctomycetota bacterium]|nr:DNA polymerase Y family protein [Planctomycetota bacterium]
MIACLSIPAFALRVLLRARPDLHGRPVALAPGPGAAPVLGPCTRAAEESGVRPGMPLGEALATCPGLVLLEEDPAAVEEEWELLLRRLEDAGIGVEPEEPGCAYF